MELFKGRIVRLLEDDHLGDRHQRFILEEPDGRTLLVAHNIDIGSRIEGLYEGAPVQVYGEYEFNDLGGLIHWTHRDPIGDHETGWVEFKHVRHS